MPAVEDLSSSGDEECSPRGMRSHAGEIGMIRKSRTVSNIGRRMSAGGEQMNWEYKISLKFLRYVWPMVEIKASCKT